MPHKRGIRRVLVPVRDEEWLALRERTRETGKSIAAQLAEIVQPELRKLTGPPPRGGAAG